MIKKVIIYTFIFFFIFKTITVGQSLDLKDTLAENPFEIFGQENIGKTVSTFSYKGFDGTLYCSKSLPGKITFINFWFEACEPCIAEFNALNELYLAYKGDNRFRFISFTFENQETIKKIVAKYKLDFPIISISNEDCYRLNYNMGFPTNIIFDKKATVKHLFSGGARIPKEANDVFKNIILPKIEKLF